MPAEAEWMDADDVDPAALRRALRFIRRVNRTLGYNRHVAASVPPGPVLDVATGSADLCEYLPNDCVGLDRHAETLAVAAEWAPDVPLIRGDALTLPFGDDAFDTCTCGMFLHHLDPPQRRRVIDEMLRVAQRRVVIADLLHNRRATAWIHLLTLAADAMTRHDARTSVRQAMTWADAQALAAEYADRDPMLRRTFGHRFVLTLDADGVGGD